MIYPADKYEAKTGFDHVKQKIAALCLSRAAAARVDEIAFMTDFDSVSRHLRATHQMLTIETGDTPLPIVAVNDITPALARMRVPGTFLPADELVSIRRAMQCIADLAAFFAARRHEDGTSLYPELDAEARPLTPTPTVIAAINRVIDQYGQIRDNASSELATIRRSLQATSGTINSIMRRVIARAVADGYLDSDTTPSVRDGRLVIPVSPMYKRKISGIVHDESASGKTVFIEPAEVVEANNRLRELSIEERREIVRILTALADTIRPDIDGLLGGFDLLGIFDFIHAKAQFARSIEAAMPHLADRPELEWYHACHPVLRQSLERQGKAIVPLDIRLDADHRLLVISGPNAG
ncbi:MAG: endonuclease MutS2, partial [Muribaculaceae bacterium]|nr:endonuclease MutS2 [Muribaculaceae bacterium]